MDADLNKILDWYETEPSLWVSIVTGNGKIFCAGADLLAWNKQHSNAPKTNEAVDWALAENPKGFGGLALRRMAKPIIAFVERITMLQLTHAQAVL